MANDSDTTPCDDCGGAGETCAVCNEIPDNCDCEGSEFLDCPTCDGNGFVDADDPDEEENE